MAPGVDLTAATKLAFPGGNPIVANLGACTTHACFLRIPVRDALLKAMLKYDTLADGYDFGNSAERYWTRTWSGLTPPLPSFKDQ